MAQPDRRVVLVTRAQIAAARLIVRRAEATGRPVQDGVRRIAEAVSRRPLDG